MRWTLITGILIVALALIGRFALRYRFGFIIAALLIFVLGIIEALQSDHDKPTMTALFIIGAVSAILFFVW